MKSIGMKITIIMLSVILLGIIITVGISTTISGNTIINESEDKVRSETQKQARIMNEWLTNHKTAISTAAAMLSQMDVTKSESLRSLFKAILDGNPVYQDVYMGYPDNTAIMGSGFAIEELYDVWRATERGWYQVALADTNSVGVTDLYVDTSTGDLCITVAKAVKHGNEVVGVVAIDILVNFLQDVVFSADVYGSGYSMLLDASGNIFIHPENDYAPDADGTTQNLATVKNGVYADLWNKITVADDVYKHVDATGVSKYYTSSKLDATGWHLVTVVPANVVTQTITSVMLIVVAVTIVILIVAAIIIFITIKAQISAPLAPATAFFNKAGHTGDISLSQSDIETIGKYSARSDEIGQLIGSAAAFVSRITEVSNALEMVADGDIAFELVPQSENDKLGVSLKKMTANLNYMFGEIITSSSQVTAGSKQVADGAQMLAQGSTEQAAAIEELSSSITEIAEKTRTNTGLAEKAAELAGSIKENAEKGNEHMDEMMRAVNEINDASGSISKVIKVIDDIAFQTNILALNAAVEAARAGQHGKGFAVVAEEVRNLAAKSAEAAKDTGSLIENSIDKANLGVRIASETAESLAQIVGGINESNQLIGEIARSSEEQAMGITQVNIGIDQVAQVVHQNSATAEESAAASEEMSAQSSLLQDLIAQFKLSSTDVRGLPSTAGPGRHDARHDAIAPENTENLFNESNNSGFGKY